MAALVGNREIGGVFVGPLPISYIFVGPNLVWGITDGPIGVVSCFSGGYWDDSLPWVDTEIWSD